jgi:uncharacterized damage-inducible protein DinB
MMLRLTGSALALGLTMVLTACGAVAPQPGESGSTAATGHATVLGDLLTDWQDQKDTMMQIADAMPEESFGYRSAPAQRTYGEQVMHVALVNVDLLNLIGGTASPPSFTEESAKTKADILNALAESYDYGTALLQEQTDAGITGTIDAGFLGPSTRARVVWFLLGHSMNTYGQMVVYLRLNGIVPPASRGV